MFNEDQRDYLKYLHSLPAEQRCWCGWYPLGKCPHDDCKTRGKSRADFLAAACPECFTLPPLHVVSCSHAPPETKKWFQEQLAKR